MERIDAARQAISERLEKGDPEGAWQAAAPLREAVAQDPAAALTWLELLRALPDRKGLREEVTRAAEAWPEDTRVAVSACATLVAAAERRAPDDPTAAREVALEAAETARRSLEGLGDADRQDPEVAGFLHANRGNALRLAGPDLDAEAKAAFDAALALDPARGGWRFDLGLLHKWRGRWEEALDSFEATRGALGDTKPVLWNLAICATALGRGDVAASAWKALGIPAEVNAARMPFVDGLDPVQVRVPTRDTGLGTERAVPTGASTFELVWAAPLSPCHGVIQTPTFREAPVDYGDVVLWDGAPLGVKVVDGKPVPRFPLLEILRPGDERRFRFVALQQAAGDVERLVGGLPGDAVTFVLEERVEHLCPRCASGEVLTKHEHAPPEEHRIAYGKVVLPAEADLGAFCEGLEREVRSTGTVQIAVPGLYEALGATKRAGQEHQAWRGIERVAIRKGLTS